MEVYLNYSADEINALLAKAEGLEPYDDSGVKTDISKIQTIMPEIVDSGAKNKMSENTGTYTTMASIPAVGNAGDYVLTIKTLLSTDSDDSVCAVGLANSLNLVSDLINIERGENVSINITARSGFEFIYIYASTNAEKSEGDTITIADAMLCTANAHDVSNSYVPYSPTNSELFAMIQALKNSL